MTERKPPRLAVWLLKRRGGSPENEALLGDLIEEFENGRSSGWFWRQTFEAFTVASDRVMPGLAMQLLILLVAWGVPAAVFFALDWRRVPLGSLHFTDGGWYCAIWVPLYGFDGYRNTAKSFLGQLRHRLIVFVVIGCAYFAAARWVGWGGWSVMLACCVVCWLKDSAEVSGMAFRRSHYRRRLRKSPGG